MEIRIIAINVNDPVLLHLCCAQLLQPKHKNHFVVETFSNLFSHEYRCWHQKSSQSNFTELIMRAHSIWSNSSRKIYIRWIKIMSSGKRTYYAYATYQKEVCSADSVESLHKLWIKDSLSVWIERTTSDRVYKHEIFLRNYLCVVYFLSLAYWIIFRIERAIFAAILYHSVLY